MERFESRIRAAVAAAAGVAETEVKLEQPRDLAHGDFAVPCFALAKARKTAPPRVAAELAPALAASLPDVAVAAAGPYLNFRVEPGALAAEVLGRVEREGERYGGSDEGRGQTVVIDLSSPNIAKPMHVGHLRSTILGAAIQRLHDTLGYRTVGINHIGDWGSQFGKLVAAIERWGAEFDLERDPIRSLLALYVRFHEQEERDPALAERARAAFRELESGGDGEVRRTWRRLTELSLREFDRVYARLGVRFDLVRGEAFYEPHLEATIRRVRESGVTEESEGALIVSLESIEKGMAPLLLRKTDGTTLYATRDLAAVFQRWEEFRFDRCLYVVGADQKLHFRQIKGVLRRMGLDWEPRVEHVDFGMMRLPEGKMSTRKGQVVFLDEVLDRAVEEARAVIAEKNPELAGRAEVAEQVGIGAIVFNDLKRERARDVVFDWKEALSFEGETGPYVQYTHARLASILRKSVESPGAPAPATPMTRAPATDALGPDWPALADARPVLLALGRFPAVLRAAAAHAEPSELSQYLLGLCRELNSWYVDHRVLGVAPELSAARLALVRSSKTVLRNGLRLLGVAAPEVM